MRLLNLGCGHERLGKSEIRLDLSIFARPDVLAKAGFQPLPFKDEAFEIVRAHHFLEHVPRIGYKLEAGSLIEFNPVIELFNEVWRVLREGGRFEITVPVFPHNEAYIDPTHTSVWTPFSFQYFTSDAINKELYGIKCSFQIERIEESGYCVIATLKKKEE